MSVHLTHNLLYNSLEASNGARPPEIKADLGKRLGKLLVCGRGALAAIFRSCDLLGDQQQNVSAKLVHRIVDRSADNTAILNAVVLC
jgi:hypothetical protein